MGWSTDAETHQIFIVAGDFDASSVPHKLERKTHNTTNKFENMILKEKRISFGIS